MPASLPASPSWTARAVCQGQATADLDPWHPDEFDESAMYAIARQVCASCPVRADCLEYGLALLEVAGVHGMFGGLTPPELRRVAKQAGHPARKQARHGTRAMYVTHKCRCDACRAGNSRSERQRKTRSAA